MNSLDQSPIMLTAASGNAADLRHELWSRSMSSLYYFTKVVMSFGDLVPHYHLDKCQEIQDSIWMVKRGFLWPRKTFKSTVLKSYVLWRLCGGGYKRYDYSVPSIDPRNKRWLFVGESEGRVVDAVKNIKWHIENNQMLRWLFPDIIPSNTNKTKWRDDEIELARSTQFDEGTIRAVGINKKFTGYHGDGFFFDDVIGKEAADSETVMEGVWDWLALAYGFINDQNDYEWIFAGTRWKFGEADVYGKFMKEQPFEVHNEKPRGIKWFVHSSLNEAGEPTFPERLNLDQLEQLRHDMRDYMFSCQFLNTPSTPSNADFNGELLGTYRIDKDGEGKLNKLIPLDGTPPVFLHQLNRISFLDPSSGGKSAGCENAIVVLGTAVDGRKFVLKCVLRNCGYRQIIEEWHQLNDQFKCHNNYYEKVGAQKTIEEFILEKQLYKTCAICNRQHAKLIPIGIQPLGGKEKDDRIRLYLQPDIEEKKVYFGQGHAALRAQVTSFPHYHLKDGVDALAYAVKCARKPSSEEEMRDEKEALAIATQPVLARICTERSYGGYA